MDSKETLLNRIYHEIGQSLVDYIPEDWQEAILNIKRVKGVAGWQGYYTDVDNNKKNIDVWEYSLNPDIIHELHTLITSDGKSRWNKLNFKLFSTGKFELDFIWDQAYQDEVDQLNNEAGQ